MMETHIEKTVNQSKEFLEFESADNLSFLLSRMLSTYMLHAPVDKFELANATYVTFRMTLLFHNLEKLQIAMGAKMGAPIFEE